MAGLGLRLFTDEMIDPRLAALLRDAGYDVESCREARRDNRGIADQEQLAYATRWGRTILTFNRRDFRRLDRLWRAQGQAHAGIIVSGVIERVDDLAERVRRHIDTVSAAEQHNSVLLLVR